MQCVTAVEPEWLAELGPMFFSIKVVQFHSCLPVSNHVGYALSCWVGKLSWAELLLMYALQEGHSARLDQRKKEAKQKEVMETEMEAMERVKLKAEEEAVAKRAEQRMRERSSIVTPGRRVQTPGRTPGRRFGL
eukprot:scaffold112346_cov34-Prasinocladus_malaysianus.AAC.3